MLLMDTVRLPIGTQIRFVRDLDMPADDDYQPMPFAAVGQLGKVVGHNDFEGHLVEVVNPLGETQVFTAVLGDEFVEVSDQ